MAGWDPGEIRQGFFIGIPFPSLLWKNGTSKNPFFEKIFRNSMV